MAVRQTKERSIAKLLANGPDHLAAWLDQVEAGQRRVPKDFNWHGLAFSAAANARRPIPEDLAWGRVGVSLYERLAQRAADEAARFSFLLSAMLVRARMIALLGPRVGDPVLDPNQVFNWFFSNLPMTTAEAAEKAADWRSRSLEQIGALRRIKNRLGVIKELCDSRPELARDDIKPWLALREKLP